MRRRVLFAAVGLAIVVVVFPTAATAGPVQPTVVVPAGGQVVLEGDAGLFAHGWHDGGHGSDVRNVTVPECGAGFVEIVTITNTATVDKLTKYYWNPSRAWTPRGNSPQLVAVAGCQAA